MSRRFAVKVVKINRLAEFRLSTSFSAFACSALVTTRIMLGLRSFGVGTGRIQFQKCLGLCPIIGSRKLAERLSLDRRQLSFVRSRADEHWHRILTAPRKNIHCQFR